MKDYTRDMLKKPKLTEKNLYIHIQESASARKDKPMLMAESICKSADETLILLESLAVSLDEIGVKRGDIIALRTPRTIDTVLVMTALQFIGAVTALCNPHYGIKRFIENSGVDIQPDWYISDESGEWILYSSDFHVVCGLDIWNIKSYSKERLIALTQKVNIKDAAFILFTSGSTGKEKAVLTTQSALINPVYDIWESADFQEGDVALFIIPFYHVFALSQLVATFIAKQVVLVPPTADIEDTFKNIERYRANRLFAVPTYFLNMASSGLTAKYDIGSLRVCYTAGGPYTEAQYRFVESTLKCRLGGGYGMSEFVGISLTHLPAPLEMRAKGVGFVYKNVDCVIKNEKGDKLPLNVEGEICVKGYSMMMCYFHDEAATKEIIDEEGYLHTGDLGYLDDDGTLYITGRIKDLIIRAGQNLSPFKIESALAALPYVKGASVCGLKDYTYGEIPAAMVAVTDDISIEQIKQDLILTGRIVKPEIPEKILVVKELPVLSTGKVDRVRVKEALNQLVCPV